MASRIRTEDVGDVCVVHFTDRKLTSESDLEKVGDELMRLVEVDGKRKLLLDFANVERKSTAMLGKLIALDNRLKEVGGKLVLSGIAERMLEAYRLTRLDAKFTIVKDEQTGLNSF